MYSKRICSRSCLTNNPRNFHIVDGWPDILTTSLAPWEALVDALRKGYQPPNARSVHPDASRLFCNNGNGTFTDATFESKLFYPTGTMGTGVADVASKAASGASRQ